MRADVRCPKCGELCYKAYRATKHGDFIGCNNCVTELFAASDADANPGDYGLPDDDEEEN